MYFTEALPYAVVNVMTLALYADMKIPTDKITFWTSMLSWPWVIKPLWSPFIEIFRTKRWWVIAMQMLLAMGTAGTALSLHLPAFFTVSLVFLAVVAFASATHDVAADGFYMLALNEGDQSLYVGLRSTFYRMGMISVQGGLLVLVGQLQRNGMNSEYAWTMTVFIAAAMLGVLFLYHSFLLPKPSADRLSNIDTSQVWTAFAETFAAFFRKPFVWGSIIFILLYRLPEAFLIKMIVLFLKAPVKEGGLGLPNDLVGVVYGTIGVGMLLLGGIVGGILVSKYGLRKVFWFMVGAIHIPNAVFLFLSYAQPDNVYIIGAGVALEQFGYGLGFTAFMLYLILLAEGEFKTAHYAIATGLMAAGMMIPGAYAGNLKMLLGWQHFFVLVMLCMIPSVLVSFLAYSRIPAGFGIKTKE